MDDALYDEFVDKAVAAMASHVQGDPMADGTNMGPLAQDNSAPFLQGQVADAVERGARIVSGTGKSCTDAAGNGRFFSPTLLADCDHTMDLMMEGTVCLSLSRSLSSSSLWCPQLFACLNCLLVSTVCLSQLFACLN